MTVDQPIEALLNELLNYLISESGRSDLTIPAMGNERWNLLRALMNVRPPEPVPPGLLAIQDRLLQYRQRSLGVTDLRSLPPVSTRFNFPGAAQLALWQGDITTLAADAIVNAANSSLLGCFIPLHGGIDNAIHSAAGMQLRSECHSLMQKQSAPEPAGRAKITGAYNLPARFVIHTVGPCIEVELTARDEALLAACYRSCLEAAAAQGSIKNLAFCCISTGVFGFPPDRAAQLAIETVMSWLCTFPQSLDRVVFNVFSKEDYHRYQRVFAQ